MRSRRRVLAGLAGLFAGLVVADAARAQSVSYTYDVFGRVTSVTYLNGQVTTYSYDNADNRTGRSHGAPPPPPPPPPPPGPLAASLSGSQWYEGDTIACYASGGVQPYVYLWQRVSGQIGFSATNPNGATTAWINNGPPPEFEPVHAQWRCRVTDAASTIAYSGNVRVTFGPQ